MTALHWIVAWAGVSVAAAVISGIVAARKNRNPSTWAAWGFIFPPALVALAFLSRSRAGYGYEPHATLDDEDREAELN